MIGRECIVADRVMLIDFDHGVVEVERPIRLQGIYKRDVKLGHNVWIGYGACVLRGVTIGNNADRDQRGPHKRCPGQCRGRWHPGARDPDARGAAGVPLGVGPVSSPFESSPGAGGGNLQERGQSVSSRMWVALGVALVAIAAIVVLAATSGSPRHSGGVRHFSLAAVTRPSATRRVLELSAGRGDLPAGARRVGDRLLVDGSPRDDTLIVDFSHGNPIPSGGLVYDGTGHTTRVGNVLVIRGGHFRRDVYDFTSSSAGSIHLDRTNISYRNLQPVANTGTASDAVFNLPAGANDAALQDDGTPGNDKSELFSGNATFETTAFTNPSSSLTVNGGGDSDRLTLDPADSFSAADVTIGSEGLVDAESLTTTGTLRITAGGVFQCCGALVLGAAGVNTTSDISLGSTTNAIGTFAGSASSAGAKVGVFATPLSVGPVTPSGSFAGASGASTNNGDVDLSTRGTSLPLSGRLDAGTGRLTAACLNPGHTVHDRRVRRKPERDPGGAVGDRGNREHQHRR